eukprot:TRINITY_DN5924_c0_g1_i2.p2 TRINITY_DN5924_c0_g1~~TRINITY_DN5924_c0_g1_i2.p2  ORF type:complete len:218 (-),score=54.44 TRINITY_DN5924_c0_g1_i2:23-676(-)
MPSTTTVFSVTNKNYTIVADFGPASRNSVSFSPNSKIMCVGGFGNLTGDMDFWNMTNFTKIGSIEAHCTTQLSWSPDSRFVACAICTPRMRVDNGFKLITPRGEVIHTQPVTELYEFSWRPSSSSLFPTEVPAPLAQDKTKKEVPKPQPAEPQKYIPPHLRNAAAAAQPAKTSAPAPDTSNHVTLHKAKEATPVREIENYIPGLAPETPKKKKGGKK